MKYVALILTMVAVFGFSSSIFAQGEATVLFLLINPGARQGGMGEAGVATANDATAIYWNPGGLAFQYENPEQDHRGEVTFMHVNWLPQFNLNDLYYDFAATRYYIPDVGMVGVAVQYINYGENIQTDTQGRELGTFNSNEVAITGSYAVKASKNLGIGVNLKYIYSNLSPNIQVDQETREGRGTSFAVDVGLLYHPGFSKRLTLGMNVSNIGPKMTFVDKAQADPLPTNLRLGFAYRLVDGEFNKLTIVYDTNRLLVRRRGTSADNVFKAMFYSSWTDRNFFKTFSHSVGAEYWYTDLIALRAGYFYEPPESGDRQFFTFGGGLRISFFGVDFSYIAGSGNDSPLSNTLRFSLLANF